MAENLHELFASILNLEPDQVTDETSPETVEEWDSLNNMILLAGIEETYGVELTTDEITSMKNVGKVREILLAKGVEVG